MGPEKLLYPGFSDIIQMPKWKVVSLYGVVANELDCDLVYSDGDNIIIIIIGFLGLS